MALTAVQLQANGWIIPVNTGDAGVGGREWIGGHFLNGEWEQLVGSDQTSLVNAINGFRDWNSANTNTDPWTETI